MDTLNIIPRLPNENNRQYAYRLLRQNIMVMSLPPGSILNETSISNKLNISRTPVHEALLSLKLEGLVDIFPQSKSRVTHIDLACVREGLFFRNLIETQIYKQIAGFLSSENLNQMQNVLELTKEYIQKGDEVNISTFFELDDEFHKIAYYAAQKQNIWQARLSVCSHYDRIRFHGSITKFQDLNHIYKDHIKLYEYLLLGDCDSFDFDEYYKGHLGYFYSFFSDIYNKNPDFFSS